MLFSTFQRMPRVDLAPRLHQAMDIDFLHRKDELHANAPPPPRRSSGTGIPKKLWNLHSHPSDGEAAGRQRVCCLWAALSAPPSRTFSRSAGWLAGFLAQSPGYTVIDLIIAACCLATLCLYLLYKARRRTARAAQAAKKSTGAFLRAGGFSRFPTRFSAAVSAFIHLISNSIR